METPERIIELNFNRKDFEEIYFKNGQGNIFFSPSVKPSFILFISILTLFVLATIYSLMTNKLAWMPAMLLLALLWAFVSFFLKFRIIAKWRREVVQYIDDIAKIKDHKLALSPNTLSSIEDGKETIVKWTSFSKLVIEDDYLSLSGSENYFLPRKSMSAEDYNYLTEIARTQIKNGSPGS